MSVITRLGGLPRLTRSLISKPILHRNVNTSRKNTSQQNVISTVRPESPLMPPKPDAPTGISKKNWLSYGFCDENYQGDRHMTNQTFFVAVSICLIASGFGIAFKPDYKLEDWAQREAYIMLREREAKGLPPIDCNLIDPDKIRLPTDEELGDTEIII